MRYVAIFVALTLAGCSQAPETKQTRQPVVDTAAGTASTASKHPLAKYIEFGGFRIREGGAGKLQVKFIAVNHSEADLGELTVKLRMTTSAAKPDDPPVAEFEAKIPSLGPQEIKDVAATVTTKKKAYEIPDWQFIRTDFDIIAPAP